MFATMPKQQQCFAHILNNKTTKSLPLIFGLRFNIEKYQSINTEETFRKARKLTLRLYAACTKHAYISFAELEAAR